SEREGEPDPLEGLRGRRRLLGRLRGARARDESPELRAALRLVEGRQARARHLSPLSAREGRRGARRARPAGGRGEGGARGRLTAGYARRAGHIADAIAPRKPSVVACATVAGWCNAWSVHALAHTSATTSPTYAVPMGRRRAPAGAAAVPADPDERRHMRAPRQAAHREHGADERDEDGRPGGNALLPHHERVPELVDEDQEDEPHREGQPPHRAIDADH